MGAAPHVDTGDFVVVTNAAKIRVTGGKANDIEYDRYTRYAGGRKVYSFKRMHEEHPERLIQLAVKRMLPRGTLGRYMFSKLKVYSGGEHPPTAQKPEPLAVSL